MTSAPPLTRPCPMCRKPAQPAYAPFCSKRCADVDLQRWLTGGYVIPGGPSGDAEEAPSTPEDGAD